MKEIPLSQGRVTVVDDDDYEELSRHRWWYGCDGYAIRKETINGKGVVILMHRVINKTPAGFETDHIDKNKLNNCKNNLRTATNSLNQANKGLQKNNKSGFRGVCFNISHKKWQANIKIKSKRLHLGYFNNPIDAANAYDKKAKEVFGEFAFSNLQEVSRA